MTKMQRASNRISAREATTRRAATRQVREASRNRTGQRNKPQQDRTVKQAATGYYRSRTDHEMRSPRGKRRATRLVTDKRQTHFGARERPGVKTHFDEVADVGCSR